MLKGKKAFSLFVCIIVLLSCMTVTINAENKLSINNVSLKAENCNIIINFSDDENYAYEYDKTIFEVSTKSDNKTLNICASLRNNAKVKLTDIIKIYIPKQEYKTFSINSKSAGVSLPALDSNLTVICEKGSISLDIPMGFDKAIDFNATNSAGRITFDKKFTNYYLKLKSDNSAISIDKNLPSYKNRSIDYEHFSGNDDSKININVKNSSFAISVNK